MEYVSASRINTYLMCPLKYRFRYIENISPKFKNSGLAFGSAVHSALNWVHEYMLAGEKPGLEDALRIFRADWASQQVETINYKKGESREGLQKLGEQLISIYYAEYPDLKVRATERPFKVPLEDLTTGESFEVPLPQGVKAFSTQVKMLWYRTLRRPSQKSCLNCFSAKPIHPVEPSGNP